MARPYHSDLRSRAIDLVNSGSSVQYVSKLLKIGKSSIYTWLDAWQSEGRKEALSGYQKGHSHKITDKAKFEEFILSHPDKTQKELGALWNSPCCAATICKGLREIDYTYKKRVSL
jgi:transposase